MAEPIYTRDNLRNLVQLSSLINSSLDTQEALNNALMSVEQSLNAEVSSIFEVDQVKGNSLSAWLGDPVPTRSKPCG